MNDTEHIAQYPAQLRHSTRNPQIVFELQPELIALHNPASLPDQPKPIAHFGNPTIAVLDVGQDNTQRNQQFENAGPVYALVPGGQLAVPTGNVFIRFSESIKADMQHERLLSIGFAVASIPEYAPNAAWLTSTTGNIADALRAIPTLESLEGVENVEPEMLMERSTREGGTVGR